MTSAGGVTIVWADLGEAPVDAPCRDCGAAGGKRVVLTAQARLPKQALIDIRLLECPACGCAFAEEVPAYGYEGEATASMIASYAESGAGLWPIVRTLARLRLPPGAAFLEIGCGFGFGLDFAIRARGWRGRGIDPSGFAVAGRALLGLPIESRFFGAQAEDAAAGGQDGADCILASEVLEHMADPGAFVTRLRRGLAAGGVLVLTTPDRAQLLADSPLEDQVPLLSAGAHLVLQTADSLRLLLHRCGFSDVDVQVNGAQLVGYAAMAPLVLEQDEAALRRRYRDYLGARADALAAGTMLWWSFAGRAYQEAVADADGRESARFWPVIRRAWLDGFGVDPEQAAWPCGVRPPADLPADLDELARRAPQAAASLLYARALDRLHGGATLAEVAPLMRAAAAAAADRTATLMAMGAPEAATVDVRRKALEALAAVAADAAEPDCLEALEAAIGADPGNRLALVRRSFVGLVNAAAFDLAGELRGRWDIGEPEVPDGHGELTAQARDVLLCLGISALQSAGSEQAAIGYFCAARAASAPGDTWWSALRGECVALDRLGRHGETTRLLLGVDQAGMPADLQERQGEN